MAPDAPGCTCAPLQGACRQMEGGELVGASCLLGGQGLGCRPSSRLPGTEASDTGVCPKRVGAWPWCPSHSSLPEELVGAPGSQPRDFRGGWGGSWAGSSRHPQPPPRSSPRSAAPCLPTAVPSWVWHLEVPVCPGLGLGPCQLWSRGWRSAEVAVFLYTRNWIEIWRGRRQGQTEQRLGRT